MRRVILKSVNVCCSLFSRWRPVNKCMVHGKCIHFRHKSVDTFTTSVSRKIIQLIFERCLKSQMSIGEKCFTIDMRWEKKIWEPATTSNNKTDLASFWLNNNSLKCWRAPTIPAQCSTLHKILHGKLILYLFVGFGVFSIRFYNGWHYAFTVE